METTYSSRCIHIFGEQHTLRLDDEEVDELVDISNHHLESLARNGVVLAGAELGGEAVVQKGLPGDLGGNGDSENHPGELESPANKIKVPNREDKRDERSVGNGRSAYTGLVHLQARVFERGSKARTRVAPRQELREERVVVCQRLAGGSRIRGRMAGSGKVGNLG